MISTGSRPGARPRPSATRGPGSTRTPTGTPPPRGRSAPRSAATGRPPRGPDQQSDDPQTAGDRSVPSRSRRTSPGPGPPSPRTRSTARSSARRGRRRGTRPPIAPYSDPRPGPSEPIERSAAACRWSNSQDTLASSAADRETAETGEHEPRPCEPGIESASFVMNRKIARMNAMAERPLTWINTSIARSPASRPCSAALAGFGSWSLQRHEAGIERDLLAGVPVIQSRNALASPVGAPFV